MNILGYTESGAIRVEIDGMEMFVPDDMENRHRVMIAEWEAGGGIVTPYVEIGPPPYVPQTLSRFQARAGLMQRGLLADVEALVANSSPLAQLAWAETIEWRRDSPTLNALAKDGLGLTDAEIDELFIEAAEIKA